MATLKAPELARRFTTPLIAAFLGVLLISSVLLWQGRQPQPPASLVERMAPVPASPGIEARYGVRITQVALIADGGLVDLRYSVIDPDKAALMADSLERLPAIIARGGTELTQRGSAHRHGQNLEAGTSYFLLYTNVRNALHPGDRVSVRIGELLLAQVPVR